MPIDVFFSYDSDDGSLVRRIKDGIEVRNGDIDVYIYEDDLQPGESISKKARDSIRNADLFLVLITPNSQNSQWVQQEVGFADGEDCQIVPVLLESPDVSEPGGLLAGVEYLSFDRDDPDEFFADFSHALDTWIEFPDGVEPVDDGGGDELPDDAIVDLPMIRCLTFVRVHAFELGLYLGLIVYAGIIGLQSGSPSTDQTPLLEPSGVTTIVGAIFLVGAVRYVWTRVRVRADATKAEHSLGFHDVLEAPLFFGAGILFAPVLVWLVIILLILIALSSL
jgi:hypothetical protein